MTDVFLQEPNYGVTKLPIGGPSPAGLPLPAPRASPISALPDPQVEEQKRVDYATFLKQVQAAKAPVLQTLRSAGYSEDQLNSYATRKRSEMTAAGFSQGAIDKFLIGVTAPDVNPPAWIARFAKNPVMDVLGSYGKETGAAGSALVKDVTTPSGFSENVTKFLRSSGIWNPNSPTLANPGSPLQSFNEAVLGPFGRALDALAGLPGDAIDAAGQAVGQAWADSSNNVAKWAGKPEPFGTEGEQEAARGYGSEALNAIVANSMATGGGNFSAVRGTADVPIGSTPGTKDFVNGAKIVAQGDAPEVASKLVTIFNETGLHPAEVATDALADPTVKQDLLSTNVKTPQVYLPAPHAIDEEALRRLEDASAGIADEGAKAQIEAAIAAIKEEPKVAGTALAIIDRTSQTLPQAQQAAIQAELGGLRRGPLNSLEEPPVPEGMVRLYRGETAEDKVSDLPEWLKDDPKVQGTINATGRWFSATREEAEYYAKTFGSSGTISYVDVPKDDVAKYLSANQPDVAGFSAAGQADKEYFVSKEIANRRVALDGSPLPEVVSGRGEGGGGGEPPVPPAVPPSTGAEPPRLPSPLTLKDATKNVLDTMVVGRKKGIELPSATDTYIATIDQLYALKKYPEAYKLFRLLTGTGAQADYLLHFATFDYKTLKDNGLPLFTILRDVAKIKPVNEGISAINEFRAYIKAVFSAELEYNKIQHGVPLDSLIKVGLNLKEKWQGAFQMLLGFEDRLLQIPRDAGIFNDETFAKIKKYRAYIPMSRVIPDEYQYGAYGTPHFVKDPVGFIKGSSAKTVDPLESLMKMSHLFMTMANRNVAVRTLIDAILGISDNGRPIINAEGNALMLPIERTEPTRTPALVRNALSTHVNEHTGANFTADDDLINVLSRMIHPDPQGIISFYRDGVLESHKVDMDIYDAVHSADMRVANLFTKIVGSWASAVRGTYIMNPTFWLRHIPRDMVYAPVTYPGKGIYHPGNFIEGLVRMMIRNEGFDNWIKGGGGHVSYTAMDRKYIGKDLKKLEQQTGLFTKGRNVGNTVFRGLQFMTDLALNASHLGAYMKYERQLKREQGYSNVVVRDRATGRILSSTVDSKKQIQDAAWVSRETGIDTARIGAKMHAWNQVNSSFFNPTLQDSAKILETIANPKTTIKALVNLMLYITIPSVALWYTHKDDPHYQDQQDYEKDLWWTFNTDNYGFHISKPFATGILFGSLPERLLQSYYDYNKGKGLDNSWLGEFGKDFVGTFAPMALPIYATPILDQFSNKIWNTGDPLIPNRFTDKGILPEYNYEPNTTETAKAFAMFMSQLPGVTAAQVGGGPLQGPVDLATNPILIEHYISAWTGGAGVALLQATDIALRKLGVLPDPVKPEGDSLIDNPFIKGFVTRHPQDNSGIISRFYDQYSSITSLYDTLQNRLRAGDLRVLATLGGTGGVAQITGQFNILKNFHTVILQQNQVIQNITDNTKMTTVEKRQQIDQLYSQMIFMSRQALTASNFFQNSYRRKIESK